jgi:hypothetical protein
MIERRKLILNGLSDRIIDFLEFRMFAMSFFILKLLFIHKNNVKLGFLLGDIARHNIKLSDKTIP